MVWDLQSNFLGIPWIGLLIDIPAIINKVLIIRNIDHPEVSSGVGSGIPDLSFRGKMKFICWAAATACVFPESFVWDSQPFLT